MQPQAPYTPPPNGQMSDNIAPDYGFLNEQHKKSLVPIKIPLSGKSLPIRLLMGIGGVLILVIVISIIKSALSTSPINESDYYLIAERQQEMLHILTTDVTQTADSQLSLNNQNFVATASLALQSAQTQTLTLLTAYKDKVNTSTLDNTFSASIDQDFTNALSANDFNSVFNSQMAEQLSAYQQELKVAYASTHVANGVSLLKSEYSGAQLLAKALNSPSS